MPRDFRGPRCHGIDSCVDRSAPPQEITLKKFLLCSNQTCYFDPYLITITRWTEKRLFSILSRHLFLDDILMYKNKHENEHIPSIHHTAERNDKSQFPTWEDTDGEYPSAHHTPALLTSLLWSCLTTYVRNSLISWKPSVGGREGMLKRICVFLVE